MTCRGCGSSYTGTGIYCSTCKVYNNGFEYYLQLKDIAGILDIPFGNHRDYSLTDAKWSSFFTDQVRNKWKQLKKSQLSPETQQSELFTENKQLTTALNLKDKELKDLQAEIRALHSQLTEKENTSPYLNKINKLEEKMLDLRVKLEKTLNLVRSKLEKWAKLLKK